MKISARQILALSGVGVLMLGLGVLVALAQQRQDLRKRADTSVAANDGVLDCDPGTDPYNSNSITAINNSDKAITNISFDVFRCQYVPGIIEQYRGSFKCEPTCNISEPNCLEGVWDGDLDQRSVALQPGESKTFSATANTCEIIQIDVRNDNDEGNEYECHNVQSLNTVQPGERWPGGIAFGISQNSTGYNPSTGTCPQPTVPPTVSPTSQPTAPPGYPTYTPIPTTLPVNPTLPPKGGSIPTSTPIPTMPVSGSVEVTAIGILGGIGLLIIAVLAL